MQRSLQLLGKEYLERVRSESKKINKKMATMIQVRSNGGSVAVRLEEWWKGLIHMLQVEWIVLDNRLDGRSVREMLDTNPRMLVG